MNENTHQHILIVDDDARLRDLLTRYLGEQGFTVRAVADAGADDTHFIGSILSTAASSDDEGAHLVLIDGQQRLTTLWLILRFMQKGEPRYRLEYQTRPGSQDYLRQLDPAQAQENIDYFHMHQAHATITGWFTNKMGALYQQFLADDMFRFLSTSVRVIWY